MFCSGQQRRLGIRRIQAGWSQPASRGATAIADSSHAPAALRIHAAAGSAPLESEGFAVAGRGSLGVATAVLHKGAWGDDVAVPLEMRLLNLHKGVQLVKYFLNRVEGGVINPRPLTAPCVPFGTRRVQNKQSE